MSIAIAGISQGIMQAAQSVAGAASSTASTATQDANSAASTVAQSVHGSHHHRHGGGGAGHLFQKIEHSVLSALQSQSQNPTAQSENQTVQSAIAQVLKARFSNTAGSASTSSQPPDNTDVDHVSVQQFFSQLQSYGITPEQFRQDFLSAMQQQSGQNSTNNQTTPVPLGFLVNLLA